METAESVLGFNSGENRFVKLEKDFQLNFNTFPHSLDAFRPEIAHTDNLKPSRISLFTVPLH